MLTLDVLNRDCTINSFNLSSNATIVGGETAVVVLRLFQADRKIRYIPEVGATFTVDLLESDGDVISKNLSLKFPADDRSILELSLSAAETANLISQNLIVKITEGANIRIAVLQMGLKKVSLGNC